MGAQLPLVDLRQAQVSLEAGSNIAGEERDTLHFAPPLISSATCYLADVTEPVWLFGALIRAGMLVGALESSLDKAVSYANERSQFGKRLANFRQSSSNSRKWPAPSVRHAWLPR